MLPLTLPPKADEHELPSNALLPLPALQPGLAEDAEPAKAPLLRLMPLRRLLAATPPPQPCSQRLVAKR